MRPIKTGLCAYGMSGQVFHAPFLDCLEEFEWTAVTERHQKKATDHYPYVHSYDSIEELFNDNSLELIIVNTPNVTHYEYSKKALLSGKHVIVEKPFTATVAEAEELINIAKEQDKKLVVFQNRRWDSDFMIVRQVLESKKLGSLIEAEFHYDRYKMAPSVKKHKEKAAPGVGLIYDLGPHLIDQAITLFGKPKYLFARIETHRPHSLVDDYFMIQLQYQGFSCTLKSSLLVCEPLPAYILHGTEGSFLKSRSDVQEQDLQLGKNPCSQEWGIDPKEEKGLLHTFQQGTDLRKQVTSPNGDYTHFFKGIYQSIREQKPTPIPLADSLLNIRLIEAALQSQKENRVVSV